MFIVLRLAMAGLASPVDRDRGTETQESTLVFDGGPAMKAYLPIIMGALLSMFVATELAAQTQDPAQDPEQACGNDVYVLCQQAIPDEVRITACLRAHWDEVSHICRKFMANYAHHPHHRRHGQQFQNYDQPD
jgi:hypothetical protein